jgi:hypothetical protein
MTKTSTVNYAMLTPTKEVGASKALSFYLDENGFALRKAGIGLQPNGV